MARLKILDQIDDAIEEAQNPADGFRNHLGFSEIGTECKRKLWYNYHWFTLKYFKPRILRLFQRGRNEEAIVVEQLRNTGVRVLDIDPNTGEQFRFTDKRFPQISGSLDGIMFGVPETHGGRCGLEIKTMKASVFKECVKKGVEESQPKYFSQMQGYMLASKTSLWPLDVFLFLAVNKDNDEQHAELVFEDTQIADVDIHSARFVVSTQEPPDRISQSEDFFKCKLCDHSPVCHNDALPHESCRTCSHSKSGKHESDWRCLRFDILLDRQQQLSRNFGCAFYSARKT